MKNIFANLIMGIVILLIIGVFALFGIIFWQEISQLEVAVEPENFQTTFSDNTNTIEENIQTPEVIENPFDQIKDKNLPVQNVDYSQININRYFYNQLEEPAKIIYKAFVSNKENMKTGTYQVDLGNNFSSLLNTDNGQEALGKYYQSAIEAYTYDNPDVFYLSPNKMYLNIETTTSRSGNSYHVYINNGNEKNYFSQEFSSKEQVEQAIQEIENVKNQILARRTSNSYQNIKMVHDYLVDTIEYDTSISKANIYNVYGALINHVSVCEGYARAFKYLMDEMQIPCVLVIGKGTNSQGQTENHAWNYIQLNGTWYAVDSTWDDPVVTGGGHVREESKYRYFLKGNNTFQKDHIPSGQFTPNGKVFEYPNLSINDY